MAREIELLKAILDEKEDIIQVFKEETGQF
jgi:hypothetical protein